MWITDGTKFYKISTGIIEALERERFFPCKGLPFVARIILGRHGPLARYVKLRMHIRRECRGRLPRHRRLAIPTCITAHASRTCRDACRDR